MLVSRPRMILLYALSFLFLINACRKNKSLNPDDPVDAVLNLPANPFTYDNPNLPAYLTAPAIRGQLNTPADNPVTNHGATLGRVLFYDKNLSANNTVSCASCHKPELGFSDTLVKSRGFNGGLTARNSMSLVNAAYYAPGRFFWDQRATSLEEQVLIPVQDLVEMGMTLPALESKLSGLAYYPPLFEKAFGDNQVNSDRIAKALSQFVRSLVTYRSKYDVGRSALPAVPAPAPNTPFPNFTTQENRGKEIFLTPANGCAACHGTETFVAPAEKNNGIDLITTDRGFGAIVNNPGSDATFKVTTLRNVELTAPYMHDGRFRSLEEVVEHYSTGVRNHPNLSPQIKLPNGQPRLLNLSAADKAALVAFLKTLTDRTLATEEKFGNPFR